MLNITTVNITEFAIKRYCRQYYLESHFLHVGLLILHLITDNKILLLVLSSGTQLACQNNISSPTNHMKQQYWENVHSRFFFNRKDQGLMYILQSVVRS